MKGIKVNIYHFLKKGGNVRILVEALFCQLDFTGRKLHQGVYRLKWRKEQFLKATIEILLFVRQFYKGADVFQMNHPENYQQVFMPGEVNGKRAEILFPERAIAAFAAKIKVTCHN